MELIKPPGIDMPPWRVASQDSAMAFARVMEEQFLLRINEVTRSLPRAKDRNELIATVLGDFLDALLTTSTGICATYMNKSAEFEEQVVQSIRDKFSMLRKMEIEGKGVIDAISK